MNFRIEIKFDMFVHQLFANLAPKRHGIFFILFNLNYNTSIYYMGDMEFFLSSE